MFIFAKSQLEDLKRYLFLIVAFEFLYTFDEKISIGIEMQLHKDFLPHSEKWQSFLCLDVIFYFLIPVICSYFLTMIMMIFDLDAKVDMKMKILINVNSF